MKFVKYIFLVGAIALFCVGLYYWLALWKMDYAAFFMAIAAIGYTVYLHITKADK